MKTTTPRSLLLLEFNGGWQTNSKDAFPPPTGKECGAHNGKELLSSINQYRFFQINKQFIINYRLFWPCPNKNLE